MKNLEEGEMVEADDGYRGEPKHILRPSEYIGEEEQLKQADLARARQETVNRRLKHWGALGNKFTHDKRRHSMVAYAVAVITQLEIENGMPLFDVEYND